MIFVDSNIPMYLVGANDRYRVDAPRLLEQAVLERRKLVTSAEVLQEILHRYVAIGRRGAIQPGFDALGGVGDEGRRPPAEARARGLPVGPFIPKIGLTCVPRSSACVTC